MKVQSIHVRMALIVVLGALALAMLTSCAHVDSFRDRLAVGYGVANTIADGTMAALQARKLTPDDAENVIQQADNLKRGLDVARKLEGVDLKSAEAKLAATRTALKELKAYLDEKERP